MWILLSYNTEKLTSSDIRMILNDKTKTLNKNNKKNRLQILEFIPTYNRNVK